MRTAVNATTATLVSSITPRSSGDVLSLPAASACVVASANSGKLAKCVARHSRFGMRDRSNDVASIATSR
jgi:hypothetical protein